MNSTSGPSYNPLAAVYQACKGCSSTYTISLINNTAALSVRVTCPKIVVRTVRCSQLPAMLPCCCVLPCRLCSACFASPSPQAPPSCCRMHSPLLTTACTTWPRAKPRWSSWEQWMQPASKVRRTVQLVATHLLEAGGWITCARQCIALLPCAAVCRSMPWMSHHSQSVQSVHVWFQPQKHGSLEGKHDGVPVVLLLCRC